VQDLLFARMDEELKPHKPSHVSEQQIESDWKLLQQATKASEASLEAAAPGGSE